MTRFQATAPLTALAALLLAGCGQSGGKDAEAGASGAPAAEAAAKTDPDKEVAEVAFQFTPGLYRTTVTIQALDIPGAPPEVAAQMKKAMGKPQVRDHCMAPDQAKKGFDTMKENMAKGNCKFDEFSASDGQVRSVFACQPGKGVQMRASSQGTYSPTGSQVAIKADMTGPDGKTMHIEQLVKSERVGDCKS